MIMSEEQTQLDYQNYDSLETWRGNNEAVPGKPGKIEYIQP
jgi:hypothetical protein